MPFVRGHPRGRSWVIAHLRPPYRAQDDQLPLLPENASPPLRVRIVRALRRSAGEPRDGEDLAAGVDESG